MIEHTFCHMPGIGPKTERGLWDAGLLSWRELGESSLKSVSRRRRERLTQYARESEEQLAARNATYFDRLLPASQAWRMFPDFENSVAFLDIETTGLSGNRDVVTTIALYDGLDVYHYVRGDNMDEFAERIASYRLLVTFNGKTFDIPFLRRHMRLPLEQAHIDLRYVLASLGFTGGLKACERRLGLDRAELADVDGYFAVLLWKDYIRSGDSKVLETLLAYNVADVLNLATIMPLAYNMKIQDTPFSESRRLSLVEPVPNPFVADRETIVRIKRQIMARPW